MEKLSVKTFNQILKESKKIKLGTCEEVGDNENLPWNDASEMAGDLGYYATFDEFDGLPEDSNYLEIPAEEFAKNCDYLLPKNHYTFLKSKDGEIYIAYDEDRDVHHVYG